MERAKKRIAIIGGGISGLTAAYEINKAIEQEKLPFQFFLLESRSKMGGIVKTLKINGDSIDVGASSFDIRREDIRSFFEELGLSSEIEYSSCGKTDQFNGHEFIYSKKPTYHGIPIRTRDILFDKGFSWIEKIKTLRNRIVNSSKEGLNTSATTMDFLEHHFSKEVATLVAYPQYSESIYGSMELCPASYFDDNLIVLFEHSSLLVGDLIKEYSDDLKKEYRFINGMETLVNRLLCPLEESHLEPGKRVTSIERLDEETLLLKLNETEEIRVGCVISTIPLTEMYQILDENSKKSGLIPKPSVSSMCTIFFQFPKGAIKRFPIGNGFVIPKRSSFHITKTTILNRKWPSLHHAAYDYLVVDIGRKQEETLIQLDDSTILSIIERELKQILGLKDSYLYARVFRWPQSVPHLKLQQRKELEKNSGRLDEFFRTKGIFIGGNGLRGYGLPNAIMEGKELAEAALLYMREQNNLIN